MAENPKIHTNMKHVAMIVDNGTGSYTCRWLVKPLDRSRHAAFVRLVGTYII